MRGVWILPNWAAPGTAALLMCQVSPTKALMNLNKATYQFFRINPEFRLLRIYPNKYKVHILQINLPK